MSSLQTQPTDPVGEHIKSYGDPPASSHSTAILVPPAPLLLVPAPACPQQLLRLQRSASLKFFLARSQTPCRQWGSP